MDRTSRRLHLRFAAATFAVLLAVGGAILWATRHQERLQAERDVAEHAQFVEHSILRDELRPSDLAAPAAGARLAQLDVLFRTRVLIDGGLRAKLYRPDGLVVYANDHTLIGTHSDDPDETQEVLQGETIRDIAYLNHEGGDGKNVKALEVYVPLRLHGKTAGVFEIYESYAPVDAAIRSFLVPFALVLAAAVLVLWIALFPLVRRMGRALERNRAARRTAEAALQETEEQLRQAQKMDAIGRLAGGVAHDFNNLLVAINGYSELLAGALEDRRARGFAEQIRAAGDRAAALTQQLLAFSRQQVLQKEVIDPNTVIEELQAMLARLLGEGLRIDLDLAPALPPIEADANQLGQVILNLAVNARDAMDGSGTLRIATRADGADAVIVVSDTGAGMDEKTQSRIFEPFFTTKDVGRGTGLGLSTVYGIVAQSGGTISVDSRVGLGTTFEIRFPATDRDEAERSETETAPEPGRGEHVLVVDDEQVVRELVARLLGEAGYRVSVAGSGKEALALDEPFDVLLTDVVMPGLDGPTLAERLGATRVVYMSGYDQEALITADAPFLQKPFATDDLLRAVGAVLARDELEHGLEAARLAGQARGDR
jgi:signal transduction histidine kinase/CheY-like chemotaxis protein